MARHVVLQLWLPLAIMFTLAGCAAAPTESVLVVTPQPAALQALVGSTPQTLNSEFGQPALRRVEGASQVWLYHSSVCGLNLILFPDSSGTPRVAEAVPDNNNPARCAASLQRTQTATAMERAAAS